jgi:hypothetical protein
MAAAAQDGVTGSILTAVAFCSCFSYCSQVPFQDCGSFLWLQVVNEVVSSVRSFNISHSFLLPRSTTTAHKFVRAIT